MHSLAVAFELAGFDIVGLEAWVYASGFPKSLNISKALDKMAGAKRESRRIPFTGNAMMRHGGDNTRPWIEEALEKGYHELPGNEPVTEEAKKWQGWGTALKPAWEPVIVGQKPL
jgi:site-specific DNA-methyltransferase (adenine-specific)